MDLLEVIWLAIIQGFTEFLPVSSSAHLILPSQLLGWQDQGLGFDVAVHVGTLMAVMIYYRQDIGQMTIAWTASVSKGQHSFESRLAWWIIFASIPLGLFGFLGKDFIEAYLRSAMVIAATTIIFGVLLGFADIKGSQQKSVENLGFKGAMIVGFAQALALIPGTSRSGITMTMGMMLGLDRQSAARFSFLLSIPAIAMAGGYLSLKFITTAQSVDWQTLALGSVLSFVLAITSIHLFLKILDRLGMMPFVIYRLILGVVLVWFVW